MKHFICFFSILAAIAVLSVTTTAFASANPDFIITYWAGPPVTDRVDAQYAEVADCNFNVAFSPCSPPTVKDNLAFLDACQRHGLKGVIREDRLLAKEPGDPDFEKNLDSVVADYANHPALYAYELLDEPNARAFPKLAAISQYLLKKDPAHVSFINLLPTYGNGAMWGTPTYQEHVNRFMETVKPKLISYDHYALFDDGSVRSDYFQNMEIIRAAGVKSGTPWMNIILVTPHFNYKDVRMSDLRWQVYTTLAYGGRGISYFTYYTLPNFLNFHNGIINEKEKPTEHFAMVKRLNAEMLALAPTLVKLNSVGVYHTGKLTNATQALPESGTPVTKIDGADMVVGVFEGPKKSEWIMLTNKDLHKVADATIKLAKPMTVSEVDKTSGKLKPVEMDQPNVLTLKFKPGDGRLFSLTPAKQK